MVKAKINVLEADRVLVPYVLQLPCALLALVPYVPRTIRALVVNVLCAQRAVMPQVLRVLGARVPYLPRALRNSCLTCFVPYVLSCITYLAYFCNSHVLCFAFSPALRASCCTCSFAPYLSLALGVATLTYSYASNIP